MITNRAQDEVVFGHGLNNGIPDFAFVIQDSLFHSPDVLDGTRCVRQRVVAPYDNSGSTFDSGDHDIRRRRSNDPVKLEKGIHSETTIV